MKKKEAGIEESLDKLDEILKKMEDEAIGLEETYSLYEEGLKIIKRVNQAIDKVEKRIQIITDAEDDEA